MRGPCRYIVFFFRSSVRSKNNDSRADFSHKALSAAVQSDRFVRHRRMTVGRRQNPNLSLLLNHFFFTILEMVEAGSWMNEQWWQRQYVFTNFGFLCAWPHWGHLSLANGHVIDVRPPLREFFRCN